MSSRKPCTLGPQNFWSQSHTGRFTTALHHWMETLASERGCVLAFVDVRDQSHKVRRSIPFLPSSRLSHRQQRASRVWFRIYSDDASEAAAVFVEPVEVLGAIVLLRASSIT